MIEIMVKNLGDVNLSHKALPFFSLVFDKG